MFKTKSTKRALLMSALSLLACVSMLIGSTFAWFTDSVTSSGNIIKAGTLEIEMLWKDATTNGKQTAYKDASEGPIFNYDLWEPGYVEAKNIEIKNIGTLDLKYQLNIVATDEVSKLADVIDVYYADGEKVLDVRADMSELNYIGTLSSVLAQISSTASGNLLDGESHTVTLALKMKESAGNDYQGLSIGSEFAVQLMATQLTSEVDSFDNQYDKMATIDNIDELKEALAADYDLIQLGANITVTESIVIPAGKTVAIDLAGYTVSQVKGDITAAYALIDNKGTLTIEDSVGTGKISFADATPYTADIGWASNTIRNTGVLTVNGGTVENVTAESVMKFSYPHAIDCYQGSVTAINGGTVKSANYDSIRMFCNSATLATTVNINGGTIINRVSFQDPSASVAGYGILNITGGKFISTDDVTANVRLLNFCNVSSNMKATVTGGTFDKGFKTQDIVNCGVVTADWLTYIGATAVASDAVSLQKAIDDAEDGAIIKFVSDITGDAVLTNGNIVIDGSGYKLNGSVNLNGKKDVTLKDIAFDAKYVKLGYDGKGNAKQYALIITGDNTNKPTAGAMNLVIDGCTFTGAFANGGASIAFTDQGRSSGGSGNVTIKNCTFDTTGAYYDIYGHYTGNGINGYGEFLIESNTFKTAFAQGGPVYLGRYASSTPVVVKGNTFETVDSLENGVYVQDHSNYGVSVDASDNTFAG